MEFKELTDEQWSFLQGFMPPAPKRGRPRLDDRKVLNGILFVLTTGCRWADMPQQPGGGLRDCKKKAFGRRYSRVFSTSDIVLAR